MYYGVTRFHRVFVTYKNTNLQNINIDKFEIVKPWRLVLVPFLCELSILASHGSVIKIQCKVIYIESLPIVFLSSWCVQ